MGEVMTAQADLIAGMQFRAEAGSGHMLTLDAAEKSGGTGAGFVPMELLLVGLAGCTGMDVISMLRKMRRDVTSYQVHVRGERASEHPMVFTEITVEHIVTGHRVSTEAVQRAVELSETRYCGAGAMLGKTAHLRHTFQVRESVAAGEPVTVQR